MILYSGLLFWGHPVRVCLCLYVSGRETVKSSTGSGCTASWSRNRTQFAETVTVTTPSHRQRRRRRRRCACLPTPIIDRHICTSDSLFLQTFVACICCTLVSIQPKCHLARHVTSRHDSTRSTCRAHAFWLCRACRPARLYTLYTTSSTGATRNLVFCVFCLIYWSIH